MSEGVISTNSKIQEIQDYIGILIYKGLADLSEIDDYFQGDFYVSYSETSHDTKMIKKTATIFTSE
jgi:hypothetical protein